VDLTTDEQKASYSLGYTVRTNIEASFPEMIDSAAFQAGIKDASSGQDQKVSPEEAQRTIVALQSRVEAANQQSASQAAEQGGSFLAENGAREAVTVLESGLQYEVMVQGEGPKPTADDTVTTHYVGTLIDGTEFDSSRKRGAPASFPLNKVIPGWTEGLQLMSVGSTYRLFVPPDLAYGERGTGGIPANSTLIFEVELISID
jgi:FKBP-type peptidyl-prolyl cis-trans isomerase